MKHQNKQLLPVSPIAADLITIHVAGSCLPNNDDGIMTYGVVITQYEKEIECLAGRRQLKNNRASNIAAEHIAMVYGLMYLLNYELSHHPIHIICSIKCCPRLGDNISDDAAYAELAYYLDKLITDNNLKISFEWRRRVDNQKSAQLAMACYQKLIRR